MPPPIGPVAPVTSAFFPVSSNIIILAIAAFNRVQP